MTNKINRDELKDLIDRDGATVAEALAEQYFEEEHLPGAVNVPHLAEEELINERLPEKDAPVVTYCASLTCRNSEILADRLVAMGYSDVREYAEGKADWIEAGLPVAGRVAVGT
jgi:rhodanese-related sulfurtransferase